jgi:hypothetical protein
MDWNSGMARIAQRFIVDLRQVEAPNSLPISLVSGCA